MITTPSHIMTATYVVYFHSNIEPSPPVHRWVHFKSSVIPKYLSDYTTEIGSGPDGNPVRILTVISQDFSDRIYESLVHIARAYRKEFHQPVTINHFTSHTLYL